MVSILIWQCLGQCAHSQFAYLGGTCLVPSERNPYFLYFEGGKEVECYPRILFHLHVLFIIYMFKAFACFISVLLTSIKKKTRNMLTIVGKYLAYYVTFL